MSRPRSLAQWLDSTPDAAAFCREWLRTKDPASGMRLLAGELKERFGCPFGNPAALGRALKAVFPDDYPETDKSVVRAWFAGHRGAEKVVRGWLATRGPGQSGIPTGLKALVRKLRDEYGYPFSSHVPVRDYALERWPALANPSPAAGRARNDFSRTDYDLRELGKKKTFIFGAAVNNMRAEAGFMSAVERFAAERDAQILSCPIRYVNPRRPGETATAAAMRSSPWSPEFESEWWDSRLHPYMIDAELRPHPLLRLMARKVQATANNPLPRKMNGRTKACSAVTGHPQLAMRTVATPGKKMPKLLYSSGAFTSPDGYSDTDAGDMAEFHHSCAAVIAEVRGSRFHLREVIWDGVSFIDIDKRYFADRIEAAPRPKALVTGDSHAPYDVDPMVSDYTYGAGGLVDQLGPEYVVLHDLANVTSVNPHDLNQRLSRLVLLAHGQAGLYEEMKALGAWIDRMPKGPQYKVVPSNHNEFIDRWLNNGEKGVEAWNAEIYHWLMWQSAKHARKHGSLPNSILELAVRPHMHRDDFEFLPLENEWSLLGVLLGQHGHKGPGGARGGPTNMSGIGTRGIYGHIHGPVIWQGANFVGTNSILRPHYVHGSPSNWMWTDCLLHDNGLRQMLHLIESNGRLYHRGE